MNMDQKTENWKKVAISRGFIHAGMRIFKMEQILKVKETPIFIVCTPPRRNIFKSKRGSHLILSYHTMEMEKAY